jgi:hypothetical protein
MKSVLGSLLMVVVMAGFLGREDSGGSLGDGHNFGDNDPNLYDVLK